VEELKAVTDEAHGQQRKVACHAYGGIGCIALWMAVAIPLSTALIWMMTRSRKCSGKARGWCPLWRFITTTGRLRAHRRASATARVRQSMKFRSKKLSKPA